MISILFFAFFVQASLNRLDPHGMAGVDFKSPGSFKNECTVCHTQDKSGVKVKAGIADTCTTCHNKSPHSGVPEHMGRMFLNSQTNQREPVNCLSCHSPHRFGSLGSSAESGLIHLTKTVSDPLSKKSSQNPMLKRRCDECHKW